MGQRSEQCLRILVSMLSQAGTWHLGKKCAQHSRHSYILDTRRCQGRSYTTFRKVIQAAKIYDASKNIVSSKWYSSLIWDIISNSDRAVKQFNVNTGDDLVQDEAGLVHEFDTFVAYVIWWAGSLTVWTPSYPNVKTEPSSINSFDACLWEELDQTIHSFHLKNRPISNICLWNEKWRSVLHIRVQQPACLKCGQLWER